MRINNISNKLNFKGAYLIAGDRDNIADLKRRLDKKDGMYCSFGVFNMEYNNHKQYNWWERAKKENKTVDVFVTGYQDCSKIMMNDCGWHSVDAIIKKTSKYIDLDERNIDETENFLSRSMK